MKDGFAKKCSVIQKQIHGLRWYDKALLISGALLVLLVGYSFVAQGTVLEAPIAMLSGLWAPLYSGWLWLCLLRMIFLVCEVCGVHFEKKELLFLAGVLIVVLGFYVWYVYTQEFVYSWDYVNYYSMHLQLEGQFAERPSSGISMFINEAIKRGSPYLPTLCYFLEVPFCFTNHSIEAYVCSIATAMMPLIMLSLAGLIKMIGRMAGTENNRWFFYGACILCGTFPMLHVTVLTAQPDAMGIIFVVLVIMLTTGFDFSEWKPLRLVLLFGATTMVILSRRWYMFWLLGYYLCYGVWLVIRTCKAKSWKPLLRAAGFAAVSGVALLAVFPRLLLQSAGTDYAYLYAFYKTGTLMDQVLSIGRNLGLIAIALIVIGLIYGLSKGSLRSFTASIAAGNILAVVFFNHVQSFGNHHLLLLITGFFVLMVLGLAAIAAMPNKKRAAAGALAAVLLTTNLVVALLGGCRSRIPYAGSMSLKREMWEDVDEMRALATRMAQECNYEEDSIYMTCFSMRYNAQMFGSLCAPPEECRPRMPKFYTMHYGFGIPGTDDFSSKFLTARYVVTCDPYQGTELAQLLNDGFLVWLEMHPEMFEEKYSVTMPGTEVTFTVHERIQPYTAEEVEYYRHLFREVHEAYPNTFDSVFDEYLERMEQR